MRYLKITLSGTVLFLVYLWVTVMLNSCNNGENPSTTAQDSVEMLEEEMDYTDAEFEGSSEFEGDAGFDAKPNDSEESTTEVDDYEAGDYTTAPKEKTFSSGNSSSDNYSSSKTEGNTALKPRSKKKDVVPKNDSYRSTTNSGGDYMVIAGSYLLEENAKKMIRKLQGLGYSNAEIIYFDQSQYHSICAGRYSTNNSASNTASSLKANGIDSYVHRKQ